MTLKEKLYPYCDNEYSEKWTSAENCEDVADEFAIGFAKYVLSQIYNMTHGNKAGISIEELLEIYKKEKGL